MQMGVQKMKNSIRNLASVGVEERREIVKAALLHKESQLAIARRYRITRSSVAQLVFQHRQNVKAGYARDETDGLRFGPVPTIRRFSWEGAKA